MVSISDRKTKTIHKSGTKWFCCGDSRCLWLDHRDNFVFLNQCDQVFYRSVHGYLDWLYVIDVTPRTTRVFDHANALTSMNETDRSLRDHEGQDIEEDTTASEEDYNDLSLTDSNSSSSSGFSDLNNIPKDINVADVDEETTSQSIIGVDLEVV